MTLSHFTITKKELFLLLSAVLLVAAIALHIPLPFFNAYDLIIITMLTFIGKGFFPSNNDTPLLLVFLASIFLTLYYPVFQVIVFFFLSFFFLKLFRAI